MPSLPTMPSNGGTAADLPWPKSPRPTKLPIVKYDSYGKCNGQLFQIQLATTSVQDGTLSTPPSATATLTFTLKGRQRQRGFTTLNRRKATNTVPATLELAGFECGQDDAPLLSSAVASPNAPPPQKFGDTVLRMPDSGLKCLAHDTAVANRGRRYAFIRRRSNLTTPTTGLHGSICKCGGGLF